MPETAVLLPESCSLIKCENQSEDETSMACDTNTDLSSAPDFLRRNNKQARQDPTSHRIIEKRRRDRMNNCLADLSRLIPPDYLKKGRGRIEKTEIIEMATRYIKFLQNKRNSTEQEVLSDQYRRGYQECLSEAIRYLVEKQGYYATDAICVQFINHLQHHCTKISNKDEMNMKHHTNGEESSQSNLSNLSHNHHFMTSHNSQHINQVNSETKAKETRHKHSTSYSTCNDDTKSYNFSLDSEQNQSSSVKRSNVSPKGSVMGRLSSFSQQNSSMINNNHNNYSSMEVSNTLEDEEESTRMNIMKNVVYTDKDNYIVQDLRSENTYSPLSYNHLQNNSESSLRNVRKQDLQDMDNHSYKFKNTIKQRFSQSQSTDYRSSSPSEGLTNIGSTSSNDPSPPRREMHGGVKFNHKRRKMSEHHNRHNISDNYDQSSSGTNSSENNEKHISIYKHNKLADSKDSLLEDSIKSDILSLGKINTKVNAINKKYEDDINSYRSSPIGVPIFALHAKGSFYVPMNVDYDALIPFLGPYDLLDAASLQPNTSLHPVTISVNFQPNYANKPNLQNPRTKNDKKSW